MKNRLIIKIILGIGLLFSFKAYGVQISIGPNGQFIDGVKYNSKAEFMNALANAKGVNIRDSQITVGNETYSFPQAAELIQNAAGSGKKEITVDGQTYTFSQIAEFLQETASYRNNDGVNDADEIPPVSRLKQQSPSMLSYINQGSLIQKALLDTSLTDPYFTTPQTQELLKKSIRAFEGYRKSDDPVIQEKIASILETLELQSDKLSEYASEVENQSNLAPLQSPDTLTTDTLSASNDTITGVVDNRIGDFKTTTGMSSGDLPQSFGIWIKSLYTKANQKAHGFTPGYKSDQTGIVAGFDVGDDIKIGAAYSFSKSNVTGKSVKIKEDIVAHIGTIYGIATMNNQFFVSGQGSYGGGDNIKKLRRTGDLLDHTASGTTKGRVTGGKVEVGYDYKIEKFSVSVVPTAGIAYNSVNVKGYRETGEGINRKISKRTTSKTSALFGIMTKYEALSGDFALVPEVHANVNYIINSKNSDTQITIIDNIPPMTTPAAKLPKLKYTIGTSIKLIEYKYFNTEIGYDLGLAKKFTSHTGLISFRAEF